MITLNIIRRLLIIAAAAALASTFLAGCGGEESTSTGVQQSRQAPHSPPTEPAITQQIGFDEIAFDSPVKEYKNPQGLVFLRFTYTDTDGNVYKCEMPKAMSTEKMTPSEWLTTFKIYRLPEVIAQKKTGTSKTRALIGLPLISPKPESPKTSTQAEGQPAAPKTSLPTLPQLPSMPSSSKPSSGPPGAGPSVPDYSKMPGSGAAAPSSSTPIARPPGGN